MSQRSGPPPIVFILLFLIIAGGGYFWFFQKQPETQVNIDDSSTTNPTIAPTEPPTDTPRNTLFPLPTLVPGGVVVRIDGSTSMVRINQSLKNSFEGEFPGTIVATQASGSSKGIQALLEGKVDLAASSRSLKPQEESQGLVAVPVATDAIAIVIGIANPLARGLTQTEVNEIFQGDITDWSAVGGLPGEIRVINRPSFSGTHQVFKELVLNGEDFGTTANITTMKRDATTPLLRALRNDGIGYATYDQVQNQSTVRPVAVDGATPNLLNYPYQRSLYYVYQNPPNLTVEAFLGYVLSPQGQQAIATANSNSQQ